MHLLIPDLASDRAAGLAQEARRHRSVPATSRRRGLRQLAAIVLIRVSLASEAAVRRLDACLADDLLRARPVRPIDGA
jgi:hypothetical protein